MKTIQFPQKTRLNIMRLEIEAKSENESFARSTVAAFASRMNLTVTDIDDIKTAVSEAVTNAVVHGFDNRPDTNNIIVVEAELYADRLMIKISDNGNGISDIDGAMQPFATTKPEQERSGMGFTVMQSFMDTLNVQSVKGRGTTISMQKFFKKA